MSSCCGFRDDFIVCSGYVGHYFDGVGNVGCGGFAGNLKKLCTLSSRRVPSILGV